MKTTMADSFKSSFIDWSASILANSGMDESTGGGREERKSGKLRSVQTGNGKGYALAFISCVNRVRIREVGVLSSHLHMNITSCQR